MTTAIDLFAGAGGFSTGARMAGVEVRWAANHWPAAVEIHHANHPQTAHACQDLQQANFYDAPAHDLLLASPACQGHSKARGKDKPHHDAQRSTAWAVVSALEAHGAQAALVENVPEFLDWALYPAWENALQRLGYSVAPHLIDSADHGVPQHRERIFIVCTRSKAPIQLDLPRREHVGIGAFIQWGQFKWSPIHKPGRSAATLARMASGRRSQGERFVAPYYGSGSGTTGRSIERPLGTVTTRDRWAVADGDLMRMLQVPEYLAAMGFPADYVLPKVRKTAIHMLGNAVCPPVAADVIRALGMAA